MYGRLWMKKMINETNDKIRYTSYKFFLEKGYEATNIRDICKMVNIKPSSLYFYYKSKQELFLSLYDEIWSQKIEFFKKIEDGNHELSYKYLYTMSIEYYSKNILNEKFLLRYHLFPVEEIATLINDRFNFWNNEENIILLDILKKCSNTINSEVSINLNDFYQQYKNFLNHQIIDMISNSIKPNLLEQEKLWIKFWNTYVLSIQN